MKRLILAALAIALSASPALAERYKVGPRSPLANSDGTIRSFANSRIQFGKSITYPNGTIEVVGGRWSIANYGPASQAAKSGAARRVVQHDTGMTILFNTNGTSEVFPGRK